MLFKDDNNILLSYKCLIRVIVNLILCNPIDMSKLW